MSQDIIIHYIFQYLNIKYNVSNAVGSSSGGFSFGLSFSIQFYKGFGFDLPRWFGRNRTHTIQPAFNV
jgi:hypothetical protein